MEKSRVGYTTGVFDLFHIGHLNILKKAKEQCDYLIVGVSTDELVKEYKNKVPIIPYAERVAIVEAIRYVDKVVPQINRDKLAAYHEIKFDVMFVGDDWKNSSIFSETEKELNKLGAGVVYFPYTNSKSTTSIVRFIRGESDNIGHVMQQNKN
ncbi:MAG: adenylyltransferase/cytidyltransferase family protein [Oscillospiraceae bacterium]|nr:adenylyltransferase/cytidyltransferase family protein [Oscillospiraceae bacterium]